jgi:MFS superfamily sulfate permease-like transporter
MIPMLGLAHLEHSITPVPVTTLDKFLFIIENAEAHTHWLTAAVSFGTLVLLLGTRMVKRRLSTRPGWEWAKFVPEVFLGVVIATCESEDVSGGTLGTDVRMA